MDEVEVLRAEIVALRKEIEQLDALWGRVSSRLTDCQDRAARAENFCRVFGEHRDKLTGSPRIRDWFSSRDAVFGAFSEWVQGREAGE